MEPQISRQDRLELEPRAGLCARCRSLRLLSNGRSVFVFCRRSETDPRFPRFPGLPVLRCSGFEGVALDPDDG